MANQYTKKRDEGAPGALGQGSRAKGEPGCESSPLTPHPSPDAAGVSELITLTKAELADMVKANVQAWLESHPPLPDTASEAPAAPSVTTFENPPEDLYKDFNYNGPPDDYERIIVQVSEDDIKAGRHKVFDLKKDGWVVEKTFLDGAIVRMKMPRDMLAKLRKQRHDQYLGYLRGGVRGKKLADPETGKVPRQEIEFDVEPEGAPMTTEQILNLSRAAG